MDMASVRKLGSLVKESNRILALTGAGISTSAGIPDFRSPGTGLWNVMEDLDAFTSAGFLTKPQKLYQLALKLAPSMETVRPTLAHEWLASLEDQGKLLGTVTQNVDGLHQMAGSKRVVELHGTFRTASCIQCGERRDMEELMAEYDGFPDEAPTCELCGGLLKPDVILFGDFLPPEAYQTASDWAENCDLFIVLGSSLLVSPANSLPRLAIHAGTPLAIINLESTPLDGTAVVVLRQNIDDVVKFFEGSP